MCRFVAYLGHKKQRLSEILLEPENSLIKQSRYAQEQQSGVNADGFGLGWYDDIGDNTPGVFKSTQPAWNDQNLYHMANRLISNCFVGHVRASTIGDVSLENCHPFAMRDLLFVHNGTIDNFDKVRRILLNELDDKHFDEIKGHTDSEHLFILIAYLLQKTQKTDLHCLCEATLEAIERINTLKTECDCLSRTSINSVLTNGKELVGIRYLGHSDHHFVSLHYRYTDIDKSGVIISSERLDDSAAWKTVPLNHMIKVDRDLNIQLHSLR